MDDTGAALSHPTQPPVIHPLNSDDLILIDAVREELVHRNIQPPSWRETDGAVRQHFYDEIRSILIQRGAPPAAVNSQARIVADALAGIGLLDPLLRDPFVEEIFVRNGEVAVEYDGAFHHLGKLADDRYFENLAIHVADQGGATLRGDRPAVLVDLPGGERFTAIVPRLSAAGTAINIRTFGRRVRTLGQMAACGSFLPVSESGFSPTDQDNSFPDPFAHLAQGPEQFLAWLVNSLSGSLLIAGEMGSGKTTLLNALSAYLPDGAPVAALETFRELEIQHPFLLRTVAPAELPSGTPGVTLDWVLNVIYTRMNPAAILVGEVVGPEALQFLKATNLGRKAFTTIHGGSVEQALMRLEQLALAAAPELGLPAVRAMVAMGVNVIALMGRVRVGERVERVLLTIAILDGLDERGEYRLSYLYRNQTGATSETLTRQYQKLYSPNLA